MNAVKASLIALLFFFKTIGDVIGGCELSLKDDFASPSPILLRNNKYLVPEPSGVISVSRSGTIVVACPGENIILGNSSIAYDVRESHCINNKTFRVDRWIGTFNQIKCSKNPHYQSKHTSRRCLNGAEIHEIGYKIQNKFHSLYESCFNKDLLTTHYVKHEVIPTSVYFQKSSTISNFIEGTMFNDVKMSHIYKVENQKTHLNSILGRDTSNSVITKKQFLSRGHLAPRADFVFRAQFRATFHYANAAPQWQRGNAGDWAALEDALRRRVKRLGRSVTVFTGTHGVMSLPDSNGVWQPLYLYADENNNALVPIPLYYYKLVYDSKTHTATAFVSINSPYYNSSTIKELTFCDDLCTESEFSWLKWRPDDGTHSFCCDYEEFTEKIGTLEDLDVRGPFY